MAEWVREKWRETGNLPNGEEEVHGETEMGALERDTYFRVGEFENEYLADNRARVALRTWNERSRICEHRIVQCKSEMRSLMNEVYQLVSLYSVFVGVVLTAVATSDRLECQHLWSPVGLSLFAYSMIVAVAFKKFREIRAFERTKASNVRENSAILHSVCTLRAVGSEEFDFNRDYREALLAGLKVPFWRNALGLLVPLTIFTAGLVFSIAHILCWS